MLENNLNIYIYIYIFFYLYNYNVNLNATNIILLILKKNSRISLVVRTPRCGRGDPGSNPGCGIILFIFLNYYIVNINIK